MSKINYKAETAEEHLKRKQKWKNALVMSMLGIAFMIVGIELGNPYTLFGFGTGVIVFGIAAIRLMKYSRPPIIKAKPDAKPT